MSKYVVSRTLEEPAWENTTVLRGPLESETERLKREPGGEIGVTGSVSVVHSLIAAGVVDEYRLFFLPGRARPGSEVVPGREARRQTRACRVSGLQIGDHADELSIGDTRVPHSEVRRHHGAVSRAGR